MSPSEEHPSPQADEPSASSDGARLASPPAPAPVPSENLTGASFAARYMVERSLGGGPIGQVYVARRDDGSTVALKVL